MENRTPLYRMTDRMVGGGLADRIRSQRDAGVSWEQIARDLRADHGVEVSSVTLKRWGQDIGLDELDGVA